MTDEPTVRWCQRVGEERERVVTDLTSVPDGTTYAVGRYENGDRAGEGAGGFLACFAADGDRRWEHRFEDGRRPKGVAVTPAGPVVAGERQRSEGAAGGEQGESDEDGTAWLGAFTADGTERWSRTYREGENDAFEAVVETPDGIVAGGSTGSFASRSPDGRERVFGTTAWLLAARLETGAERWRETDGGDACTSLAADESGALRFVDRSRVGRVAADGTEVDSTYYYGETGSSDTLARIAIDGDGRSVLAGTAWEGRERNDARLLVVDPSGATELDLAVGFPDGSSFGRDARALEEGYLLAGSTLFDGGLVPWLAHVDGDGERLWSRVVARESGGEPRLEPIGEGGLTAHLEAGRHADVDVLAPTHDGFLLAYTERDRSRRPERRRAWLCLLEW